MKKMKKVAGIILIALVYGMLLVITALDKGWKVALISWGGAIVLCVIIFAAVYLIIGDETD